MSGLDKEYFVGVTEDYLSEFLCGICREVFVEPVLTPCGHLYCKDCITQSLKHNKTCPMDMKPLTTRNLRPPSQAYKNLLNKLQIKCNFASNGCQSVVKVTELEIHSKYCIFNPNGVCKDCETEYGTNSDHNCLQNLRTENQRLKNLFEKGNKKRRNAVQKGWPWDSAEESDSD